MLYSLNLEKILFLDVETVPQEWGYTNLSDTTKMLWEAKTAYLQKEGDSAEEVYKKAGIYAEFGKIVCISVGVLVKEEPVMKFRLRSFFGKNEKKLLEDFAELLTTHFNTDAHLLCAHNGKEFDFPYIARRMLIMGVRLPKILNIAGKKPWEISHVDTMELWKFGDWKHYTSLNLLANIFNIPTPKDDIQGSDVGRVFWEEDDLERIVTYCQKDTLTVAQLLLSYRNEPIILPENVQIIEVE